MEVKKVSKRFGQIQAVKDTSLRIEKRGVFGLVGSNGAGKSTLLKMMAGIMKPDEGEVLLHGEPVYENIKAKEQIFYIPDDFYFFPHYTTEDMVRYYKNYYTFFDKYKCFGLMEQFHLDPKRKIDSFSKGMKKQLQIIMGICSGTQYLLCDETFDGLDPLMRQAIKSLMATEVMKREYSAVIVSHSLRELEDICDHVGLLHEGGILLSDNLEDMKFNIHKIQCVLKDKSKEQELLEKLSVLRMKRQGALLLITARGTRNEMVRIVKELDPLFYEVLPLSLEEIFISETEVAGYEIKGLVY